MARGTPHSDETKAQVMAALMAGQGIPAIAKEHKIPETTVREWGKSASIVEVRSKKGEEIAEKTFAYLTSLLTSLTEQARIVGKEEYILKQPASEIAVLHGVMADKGFRLLSAVPTGSGADNPVGNNGSGIETGTGDTA